MQRLASIDIGTNSTRLLVAEYSGKNLKRVETALLTTRLGKGMAGGRLLPETMGHTAEAVGLFHRKALALGATAVIVAATSAVRDASNKSDFLRLVKEMTGLPVRVLSGGEEAALSWRGALHGLPVDPAAALVVDIGGGSSEFIWMAGGRLKLASVNAGAVRLTESGAGGEATYNILRPALEEVKQYPPPPCLVGTGGTVTTLAAVDQRLARYDPDRVHGYRLGLATVQGILKKLKAMTLEERRKLPGLQPERADIIIAGVRIAAIIMENLGYQSMLTSDCDILYGLALEEVGRK